MPTYVLGLGNVLMGDDGFGPYVARLFDAEYEVGAGAEVIDVGTPGLDLTPWLAEAANVIIVDTVRASVPPGTVMLYDKADIVRHAPVSRVGPHDPGLKEALLMLEFAGRAPESVTLVGVVPARVAMGTTLSDPAAAAVPAAVTAVLDQLQRLGVPVARRANRRPVDGGCCPWWSDAKTDGSRCKRDSTCVP